MTSKELAKLLGISESAVSFALNNKPGVSAKMRHMIKEAALENGVGVTNLYATTKGDNTIYVMYYYHSRDYNEDFFRSTMTGIETSCTDAGFHTKIVNVYGKTELKNELDELSEIHASGLVIFGYMVGDDDFALFSFYDIPMVMLDANFSSSKIDFIQINNIEVAYQATNYLINKRSCQPGYLHANINTYDFSNRKTGFFNALKRNFMFENHVIIHSVSPTIKLAQSDILSLIDSGTELATSYFADNDFIAIAAVRAFQQRGFRIPEDISIISIDDISLSSYIDPPLTTMHIPRAYMGKLAAERLIKKINEGNQYPVNIQINGYLKVRKSIAAL